MGMSIRFPNLNINFDYVPQAIHFLGMEITIYGILIMLGMLLGILVIVIKAKRSHEDHNIYLMASILGIVGGIIGARLFYVIFSWEIYKMNPMKILSIRSGGLALYGALLGGSIAVAIYCSIKKKSFFQMADILCFGIITTQIVGRLGDFFNRESFGDYTENVFAMQIPLSAVRSSEVTSRIRENLVTIDEVSYIQVHPAFLYECICCILLVIILQISFRKKYYHGEIFLKYLMGYGLGRFVIELLRTDKLLWPGTQISVCAWISLILCCGCFIMAIISRIMHKKREEKKKKNKEKLLEEQEKMSLEAEKKEENSEI